MSAYGSGDRAGAVAAFLSLVGSLDWETCRTLLEKHIPGSVTLAIKDADNFFGSYLPALGAWQFGPAQAAGITQPMLSVLGAQTERWFADGHDQLHTWFPQLEDCLIEGVGHLLQMQHPQPVASGLAEFVARHPMDDNE